jgi:hypothetical protein
MRGRSLRWLALCEALDPAKKRAVRVLRRRLAAHPVAIARHQALPVPARRERSQTLQDLVRRLIVALERQHWRRLQVVGVQRAEALTLSYTLIVL